MAEAAKEAKEDAGGDEKKKEEKPSKGLDKHVLARRCRAGNYSYTVVYQASWWRCASGRGGILPVTSS